MVRMQPEQTELVWSSDTRASSGSGGSGTSKAEAQDGPVLGHARVEGLPGRVIFASPEEQAQRTAELLGAGALVITVPAPTSAARGHLGELLEELVERELARMGAPSPYLAAWTAHPEDAHARLADQLFRARSVGATGIAIAMGSLGAIGSPCLTTDDSGTLRWLAERTTESALVILVDDADLRLPAWAEPIPLSELLAVPRPDLDFTIIDSVVAVSVPVPAPAPHSVVAEPNPVAAADPVEAEATPVHPDPDPAADAHGEPVAGPAPVTVAGPEPEPISAVVPEPTPLHLAPSAPSAPPAPSAAPRRRAARAGVPVSGPNDGWRSWAVALTAARGAQPLAAFERLFAESYVPLGTAIASGLDDPRAVRAHEEFRRSFERSYTDAFATFGATNRRPRLVMDAYDLAAKQARLASARAAHVLVVDSMRYDVGCMVRDLLAGELAGIASLTAEGILWSALPTTTVRQLETFARGLDALRAPAAEEPNESLRGRAAEVVRRLRVGSRELYKLDLVTAMLERLGRSDDAEDLTASLARIAEATAEAIARHVASLPPRTLLYIVGDHGFTIDRRGEIRLGGATPEDVLCPAQSWLVGELH